MSTITEKIDNPVALAASLGLSTDTVRKDWPSLSDRAYAANLRFTQREAENIRQRYGARLNGHAAHLVGTPTQTEAELSRTKAERDGLQTELSRTKAERDGLKTETARTKAERDGLQTELSRIKAERDGLQTELSRTKAERDGLQTETARTKAERDGLQTETGGIAADRDALRADRDGLRAELADLRAKHAAAAEQLREAVAKSAQNGSKAAETAEQLAEARRKIEAVTAKAEAAQEALIAHRTETARELETARSANQRANMAEAARRQAEATLAEAARRADELQAALDARPAKTTAAQVVRDLVSAGGVAFGCYGLAFLYGFTPVGYGLAAIFAGFMFQCFVELRKPRKVETARNLLRFLAGVAVGEWWLHTQTLNNHFNLAAQVDGEPWVINTVVAAALAGLFFFNSLTTKTANAEI